MDKMPINLRVSGDRRILWSAAFEKTLSKARLKNPAWTEEENVVQFGTWKVQFGVVNLDCTTDIMEAEASRLTTLPPLGETVWLI